MLVNLMDQESLTCELGDEREEPGIMINYGNHVILPDGVALSC